MEEDRAGFRFSARLLDQTAESALAGCLRDSHPAVARAAGFALADIHQVLIRGLQRDDEDLEELFHRVIGENRCLSEPEA